MLPEEGPIAAFAHQVDAALPPGLFAEVQGLGQPAEFVRSSGWGLTWCGSPDEFAERLPRLWDALDLVGSYSGDIPCIDLTVRFDVHGRVLDAALEGEPLRLDLMGLDADQAAPLVVERIRELFSEQ